MKYCTLVLVSLLLVNVCWAFSNCKSLVQIEARQGEGSSWKTNHVHHQIYDVHITNIGSEDIEAVYAFFPSGWRFELDQGHAHAVDAHLNTLGGEIEASQPVLLSDTLLDPFAQEPLQSHEPYVPLEHFAPVDEFPTVVQELLMPDPLAAPDVLPELPLLPVDSPFVVYDPLPEAEAVPILPEAHAAREVRSLHLWPHGEGVITQVWNYDVETGEILNFGGVIASGNTWSGAGFVVAGDAIPHFAFVKAFCSRHCVNVHKADHPAVLSEQVVVLSTDPVVAAYDTPVPFHHQPYFVEPRFESCSTRYTGNYHAIAFSPATGRFANATSTRGYPIEEALDLCGEWNKADDCVILLACIDCFSAISVTDGAVDGQYLASVATGVSDYQAEDLAREQCACLAAGTGLYCL